MTDQVPLTKQFPEAVLQEALHAWDWLHLEGLEPLLVNSFGDILMVGEDGVYLLDVALGEVDLLFDTADEAKRVLATEAGMDEYLLADLAFAASEAGLVLTPSQVFGFKVPPVVGGEFDVDNLIAEEFVVAVTKAGRLHEALEGFADDDPVSNAVLVELGYPDCAELPD